MNLRRKRLRLMRDTQWRGYARTAEGNPITLSQIRSVLSLSVLGNSSQSGTPSPDNPVDVIGTGERTGNLFDISQVGDTNTLYNDGEKLKVTAYSSSTNLSVEKFLAMTGLRPGDVFTVARQYEVINGTANSATGSIRFNKKDGSGQFLIIPGNKDVAINVVPDDFNSDIYSAINFYGVNSGNLKEVVFSEIQILKGSYTADTLPPYEPYGYKVAVTASGRNLIDYTKAEPRVSGQIVDIIDNGVKWSGDYYFLIPCKLKAGKTYSLSCKGESNITWNFKYIDGTSVQTPQLNNKALEALKDVSYIVTYKNNPSVFENDIIITDIGLYEGTYTAETLPPYEPYKPPQSFNVYSPDVLHGVGAAHDTVILDFDRRKAELVKAIGFTQLKSNDNWNDNFFPVIFKRLNPTMKGNLYAMCNYMPYANNVVATVQGSNVAGTAIAVYRANTIDGVSDLDSFKAWLSDKDVYAYYPLATSTTTDITSLQDWDALPNLKGTWILTATGGTEPTLQAEFYSEERSTE